MAISILLLPCVNFCYPRSLLDGLSQGSIAVDLFTFVAAVSVKECCHSLFGNSSH